MRVLLRNAETGKYYFTNHTWVTAASRAHDFYHAEHAIQFALANQLAGVELVLTYDNTGTEVVLPLQIKGRSREPEAGSDFASGE